MPYIDPGFRQVINKPVDDLVGIIGTLKPEKRWGAVNYAITRMLLHVWKDNPSYAILNGIIGTLESVKLEFYRQFGVPYENEKRRENGPVSL